VTRARIPWTFALFAFTTFTAPFVWGDKWRMKKRHLKGMKKRHLKGMKKRQKGVKIA